MEREKEALIASLQESQTQLQHTRGALSEQHEKTLRLSQKVTALRRRQQGTQTSFDSLLKPEDLKGPDKDKKTEDEDENEEDEQGAVNKNPVFPYQSPGLEVLQCKYHVAVTEVVELKSEVKALRDRLAQCAEGIAHEKPRGNALQQRLERKVTALEKSCQEGKEKVRLRTPSFLY